MPELVDEGRGALLFRLVLVVVGNQDDGLDESPGERDENLPVKMGINRN